ncbi:EAL domain-containing protein [Marinicella litoralis]|uniref:cyclic-guanylate-specific phosphodiesterase n=1 Tax=Marinicella litoralis TaxID=644220 RepID=A0A4R6XE12_9GAMM|nr:EAL domain-containing protein [Marinicella litoralis]TDR17575.1 diguanylate cyclase/phosphodiesterase with PAS/PAC sensor(s) [Marinicella litoralis]
MLASIANGADSIQFKQMLGEDDLASNYVNHIIQRQDGFIWIATAEGISRYDGKNIINHKSYPDNHKSLPNPWVNYLLEDHNQQLWIATATGVARMLPDEINFEQYNFSPIKENSIAGNYVVHMIEDDHHRLWFATERGLSMYQADSNDFKNHYIDSDTDNIDINIINAIAQKNSQQLWIANDNGLHVFDIQTTTFTPHPLDDTKTFSILDLATESQGSLWIVTADHGLKKLDTKNHELTSFRYQSDNLNSMISDGLWDVFIDRDDNVWVASWGEGISLISAKSGEISRFSHNQGDPRSIPSNLTTGIFQDSNGLIWVSTYDGVALYDPNNHIESIRPVPGKKNSLSSDLVWNYIETKDAIWIGTTEGINRWDKNNGLIESFYSGKDKDAKNDFTSIWTMAKANDQTFWLGTEFGLAQFDTQTKAMTFLSESPNRSESEVKVLENPVWCMTVNPDQSIWVGSNSANLYLIDKEHNLIKDYTDLIKTTLAKYENIEFTDITHDTHGNLWLSTVSGLYFFNLEQNLITPVRSNRGEVLYENDWIFSVENHRDNQYWVSSQYFGLSLFQLNLAGTMDQLLHFDNSHPQIVDSSVYTIIPINDTDVWFTGRKNLYHIDLNTNEVTNYGHSNFESDLIFHENSQLFSNDELIYLGSNRGAIRFDPLLVKKSNFQPKVYLTGIKSNSMAIAKSLSDPGLQNFKQSTQPEFSMVPIHLIKNHTFDYADTIFTFEFAALNYMYSDELNYAYRIPELDEKWIELQNRNELTLTNLAAGDYHLEVKATNADLQWSDHTAAINFTLLPKPWLTWWAKSAYILITLLILSVFIRLYRSRLMTQYALAHREVQLSQAIWGSGDELWEWDIRKQQITRTNSEELDDQRSRFFNGIFESNTLNIHPDDIEKLQQKIQDILSGKSNEFDAVYRQMNSQGDWLWMQDRAKVTRWSSQNKPIIINGISRNINTIKKKEERSQLIATAFQSSSDGALVLDSSLKIVSINAAFTDMTGYDERIIDKTMLRDSGHISTDLMNSTALFKHIKTAIESGDPFRNEIAITTITGQTMPVDLRVNSIYNAQKKLTHFIATITDITYRKTSEEALKKLANYDSLTGLPNRSLMMIKLNHALLQAEQELAHMAILFIDLDHFKNINDSLGHTIGDELLVAVANRLTQCVRQSDTIARIGGDEFTIGILGYDSEHDVIKVAEKVLQKMAKPFQLENHELIITPSIGIATYDGSKTDIETLLMQADTAMYQAKRSGRNNFRFFTESMNQAVLQRVDIEMRLRKAILNDELLLHYQPKFCLKTEKVTGFEALLRWQDANNILTPPDEFIPIAEETGLIFSIGEFVLENACKELNRWHNNGHQDISVAINLSAIQFMDKKLVSRVSQMMEKYHIPPLSLEVEITESTLIENLQYTVKTLKELKKLGVKLSLDDFGTGYSSLNYLKRFPIHALKIDRSFILDMVNDARDASMVESIISLAHKLSIEVIAEGVETKEQLTMLASYQIEQVQGFLLSEAVDTHAAAEILQQDITVSEILNK